MENSDQLSTASRHWPEVIIYMDGAVVLDHLKTRLLHKEYSTFLQRHYLQTITREKN